MNITQYGEDSMTDLQMYSKQERKDSVKDILNLGFTAQFESEVAPKLPHELSGALRFQQENMAAAVSILNLSISNHTSTIVRYLLLKQERTLWQPPGLPPE